MERIASGGGADPICPELWRACAGSSVTLPEKDSLVVYFPQGHMEQFEMSKSEMETMPFFHLPPQVICRVLSVELHADKVTDEVYARLTLLPEAEPSKNNSEVKKQMPTCCEQTPPVFWKRLTPSDTGPHGGFSVPRECALACFPALDYEQVMPAQNIVAKDLHGKEWKFRHVFRGSPPRHVLTTGWGAFLTEKKLATGDKVLFLCDQDGELRVGICKASQQQTNVTSSMLSNQNICFGVLAAAAHAVATSCIFHVFYNPRTSPSKFIIPYPKYVESLGRSVSIGMRLRSGSDDVPDRRYCRAVTGMGDIDPVRWPCSKWRSVKVEWDGPQLNNKPEWVSLWELQPEDSATSGSTSKKHKPNPKPSTDGIYSNCMGRVRVVNGVFQGQEAYSEAELVEGRCSPRFLQSNVDLSKKMNHGISSRTEETNEGSCMVFGVSLRSTKPQ